MSENESDEKALVTIGRGGEIAVGTLEGLWRLGNLFAKSNMVPKCYQDNAADCAIAVHCAITMGVNIMSFLQNSYIVPGSGKPSLEGKLIIAILNNSPQIKGRVRFDFCFDPKSCTASVVDAETGETHAYCLSWETVVANGWASKSGPGAQQWTTLWELRSSYRAATYLARLYYPDLLMGMQAADEVQDASAGPQSGDTLPRDDLDAMIIDMVNPEADDKKEEARLARVDRLKQAVARAEKMFVAAGRVDGQQEELFPTSPEPGPDYSP